MKFLKPNFWNVVLALVLFIASSWLWNVITGMTIMDVSYYGFPLHFFTAWGPCMAGQNCSEFTWVGFILDIVIWYIVSAFVVSRIRKK